MGPGIRVIERGEKSTFDFTIVLPVYNECDSISEVCNSIIEEIKKDPNNLSKSFLSMMALKTIQYMKLKNSIGRIVKFTPT